MRKIIKRDGRKVNFNQSKIYDAIQNAFEAVGIENSEELLEKITDEVVETLDSVFKHRIPHVEDVQDTIEKTLVANNLSEVAKAFIIYRYNRTRIRTANSELMKTMKDITFKKAVDNDTKRENANIDGDSPMGTMLKYGSESAKAFYLNQVINSKFAEAHQAGDIHIHDMDFYTLTMTCCQIDLLDLFKNGFSTGHGHLREPKDIMSYTALAAIAIQSNQNDQHGGQSIPAFDYYMAPGVVRLIIVSTAMAVLPVCLSPMMSSLCPLPIGTRASIAFIPVCKGEFTGERSRIEGALYSMGLVLL